MYPYYRDVAATSEIASLNMALGEAPSFRLRSPRVSALPCCYAYEDGHLGEELPCAGCATARDRN
jgi:hypothetical protein